MPPRRRRTTVSDLPVNALSHVARHLNEGDTRSLALAGRATRPAIDAARIAWNDAYRDARAGARSPYMEAQLRNGIYQMETAVRRLVATEDWNARLAIAQEVDAYTRIPPRTDSGVEWSGSISRYIRLSRHSWVGNVRFYLFWCKTIDISWVPSREGVKVFAKLRVSFPSPELYWPRITSPTSFVKPLRVVAMMARALDQFSIPVAVVSVSIKKNVNIDERFLKRVREWILSMLSHVDFTSYNDMVHST